MLIAVYLFQGKAIACKMANGTISMHRSPFLYIYPDVLSWFPAPNLPVTTRPVSYTHLDVYKRQAQLSSFFKKYSLFRYACLGCSRFSELSWLLCPIFQWNFDIFSCKKMVYFELKMRGDCCLDSGQLPAYAPGVPVI